jgi:hypothetical protein
MSTPSTPNQPYYGDLDKTKVLRALFETPQEQRNDFWRKTFLDNVAEASFACGQPQVIEGPDGFPYFQLNTPEPFKEFQCYVIKNMKDDFLLAEGFGVVINTSKNQPDWVFSYGDIVNYHIKREFYSISTEWNRPQNEVVQDKEQALIGQPSEAILPTQARAAIRKFLEGLSIYDAKIFLMNRRKPDEQFLQELVFNLTPDKFESHEYFEAVMRSIAWYLPRHYTFVSMHESGRENNFVAL